MQAVYRVVWRARTLRAIDNRPMKSPKLCCSSALCREQVRKLLLLEAAS